jgi:hypothetical protein
MPVVNVALRSVLFEVHARFLPFLRFVDATTGI